MAASTIAQPANAPNLSVFTLHSYGRCPHFLITMGPSTTNQAPGETSPSKTNSQQVCDKLRKLKVTADEEEPEDWENWEDVSPTQIPRPLCREAGDGENWHCPVLECNPLLPTRFHWHSHIQAQHLFILTILETTEVHSSEPGACDLLLALPNPVHREHPKHRCCECAEAEFEALLTPEETLEDTTREHTDPTDLISQALKSHVEFGRKYHLEIPLLRCARTAYAPEAKIAHEQFYISSLAQPTLADEGAVDLDPFFGPVNAVLKDLEQVRNIVDTAAETYAYQKISSFRYYISKSKEHT
jgi:hypothetical protein